MRAIFYGTPDFAVPSLEALHAIADIRAVVCQPDRPKGRGLQLTEPPVKRRATQLGLPVVQPTKLRNGEFAAHVRSLEVDVALVVAYGRILPLDVLTAPRRDSVNVHASLLPRHRGAAPIAWSIVHGDAETGVTLMQMDEGMDTGPMLAARQVSIDPDETQLELSTRVAQLGAELVTAELANYLDGKLTAVPQPEEGVSLAPILRKEHGLVDWSLGARRIHDLVRGMNPWPGASTRSRDRQLRIHRSKVIDAGDVRAIPGTVLVADKRGVVVQTGDGALELLEVQLEGKRAMSGSEWVNGRGVAAGDVLGPQP